ncbi:protein timeless homolog [Octopus sinensis]|uniref:Protein timeless homolog n=1 Tax=Octopus sinensis TaxID=2607531 RepID=A0A6P7TY28_9MOLL|nr:protein timeless homolog [Octopus sinensis]
MDVELQAICSALGYQEGSKYLKEPDCLESVKDLIRCLRRDDDTCSIRRQLGHAEIVQSDLLPLIKEYKSDRNLFETVIRLLLNLTQPARLCFGDQIPEDKVLRNYYMEVESILRNYKKAFVDDVLFAVLTEKLTDLLKLDWEHRHEEDRVLIERLLILVRNVLHVQPDANEEKRTDDDASIHDQVLWSLHVSGMEDLLLYVSNSADERQYCMHTLEIVTLMFRQQTPALLASAGVQRAISEKEKDVKELEIIREQERIAKKERTRLTSTRHSRFGGTFLLKNVQSISDREVIFHRSLDKAGNHSFDITKKSRKTPKNRAPIKQVDVVRRSTLSIRLCLKEFCVQFLENCYNPLMSAVKDNLVREVAQDHDETYYLWALRFFMEFCRLHSQQVELISETLSVSAFHYIQVNLLNYYEMITTDKKEAKVWAKRVHLALKAYQELLMTLHSMETSKNKHLVSSAKVLKGNIFYMMEFRDIFVVLLSKFNHSKHSTSYLTDLVHATHLFLKMLEISQKSNRCIVVQKKKKTSRRSKSSRNNKNDTGTRSQLSEEELLNLWDDVSSEVSAVLSGENEMSEGVLPFDAASEVDIDQQRADTMVRIQTCLRSKNASEAVALLRAAREVWPDNNEFGSAEMSPEDEFLALREVFMANLSQNSENMAATVPEEFEEQEDEIVEEEMSSIVTSEEELNTRDFIAKFAKPAILQSYTTLLANFKNNSTHTNHCIIKMFHRIAVDLHQEGMFFQASIFCIFREVFVLSKVKHFQEIVKFGVFIVQKFLVVAEKNKKVFMEMLFWKTAREAGELSGDYFNPSKNIKQVWTEDQEIELRRLFDEAKEDPEKDIVGHIMAHLTDETKSRGQVLRQLRISGLIESAKDLKRKQPPSTNSNRAPWTEEQETELREVFERFRGSDDPLGNVMQNLSFTKPKNKIKDKLFGLDIIQDKKELYKKRSRKKKEGRMDGSGESGNNSDSNDDDDDDGGVQEGHVMASHSDSSGEESDEVEETRDVEEQPSNSDDLPSTDIDDVLKCLVSHNYKGPVSWIQRSLRRTAEDRQTPGTYIGVPVVPLTEENEDAMEDPIFLDFLLLIGLSRPSTGQEAFWRIPGDLDGSTLTMIADGLNLDENGQPANTAELKTWLMARSLKSKTGKKQNKSKKGRSKPSENNGKRKKALMALQKKQAKDKETKGKKKLKSQKSNDEDKKISKKQRRTKKKNILEDSEEEIGDSDSQPNVSGSNSPKFSKQRNSKENKKKKRRRIEFENSSDEDGVEDGSVSDARNGSIQIDTGDESGDEPLISQVKSKQNADDDSDVPLNSLPASKKRINQDFNANCSKRKETPLARFNSSDSDSEDGRLVIETELDNFESVGTSDKKKKKRLLSDSSDEDEGSPNVSTVDLQRESDDVSLNKEAKDPQLAGPSFLKKKKKRQKLIDSESSDDGHGGKAVEELDDSVAERKTVNGRKQHKIPILESSDDDSGDEDKENQEICSTKESNQKQDEVDLFDKAKNVQTQKYIKQNPNIINNNSNNTVDTFPATLLSLPNMEPDTNVFDDHIPLVTAIRRKRVLSSDDEND